MMRPATAAGPPRAIRHDRSAFRGSLPAITMTAGMSREAGSAASSRGANGSTRWAAPFPPRRLGAGPNVRLDRDGISWRQRAGSHATTCPLSKEGRSSNILDEAGGVDRDGLCFKAVRAGMSSALPARTIRPAFRARLRVPRAACGTEGHDRRDQPVACLCVKAARTQTGLCRSRRGAPAAARQLKCDTPLGTGCMTVTAPHPASASRLRPTAR